MNILKCIIYVIVILFIIFLLQSFFEKKYEGFYVNKMMNSAESNDITKSVELDDIKKSSKKVNHTNPNVVNPNVVNPSVANPSVVSMSDTGYQSMLLQQNALLLKNIQDMIHNKNISTYSQKPIINNKNKSTNSTVSLQGKEYNKYSGKSKSDEDSEQNVDDEQCSPDMSKYIKKDEIPCWGCSIDY